MKTITLYKPVGITPLQCIEQFRSKHPEYNDVKMGYAGRLDPMAEGLLLVLVGHENKKKHDYEGLDKEYEFEILFSVSTDSYDILGKITDLLEIRNWKLEITNKLETILPSFIGKFTQSYPPYSSARVKGKPLFYWARENKLDEITIPTKDVEIYDFKMLDQSEISAADLKKYIFERIEKVKGEFRQEEIISGWNNFFQTNLHPTFYVTSFTFSCSSGTYVRALVNEISKKLNIPALTLSIKRTRVGEYGINNSTFFK